MRCLWVAVEALGRTGKGDMFPGAVDIDILLFGEEVIGEGLCLAVPHPGVLQAFDLRGIADLAPGMFIPGRNAVGELLAEANVRSVREFEESCIDC
jgi:2-amino-4-hydroxy-6-hydroxymethyldihydropteridine diphosphokinase